MQDVDTNREAYGFPSEPTHSNVQVWSRQELFLRAYARNGKRYGACQLADLSVETVDAWLNKDTYSFKKRMEQAHYIYVEKLEAEMDATIESKPTNAAILQIFRLKAEHPEKYREEVRVISNEAPALMWLKLRELAGKSGEIVEGEVRELTEGAGDVVTDG